MQHLGFMLRKVIEIAMPTVHIRDGIALDRSGTIRPRTAPQRARVKISCVLPPAPTALLSLASRSLQPARANRCVKDPALATALTLVANLNATLNAPCNLPILATVDARTYACLALGISLTPAPCLFFPTVVHEQVGTDPAPFLRQN